MRFSLWPGANSAKRRRSPFNNVGADGLTAGRVTPHLWVGGELGPDDWPALSAEGVSVVVNLQHEQQDRFAEREDIDGYLWLPSPDQLAPSLAQLRTGVSFIRAAVAAEQTVFVHCKAGQGRAPLLCACYLLTQNLTPLEAMAQIQKARPRTQLTPIQSQRLREFAALCDVAKERHKASPKDDAEESVLSVNGAQRDSASQAATSKTPTSNGEIRAR